MTWNIHAHNYYKTSAKWKATTVRDYKTLIGSCDKIHDICRHSSWLWVGWATALNKVSLLVWRTVKEQKLKISKGPEATRRVSGICWGIVEHCRQNKTTAWWKRRAPSSYLQTCRRINNILCWTSFAVRMTIAEWFSYHNKRPTAQCTHLTFTQARLRKSCRLLVLVQRTNCSKEHLD